MHGTQQGRRLTAGVDGPALVHDREVLPELRALGVCFATAGGRAHVRQGHGVGLAVPRQVALVVVLLVAPRHVAAVAGRGRGRGGGRVRREGRGGWRGWR
jgi:hypothetical protein